jgi:subtilase family serine protease/Tol biopolymer transport system component/fibronectin type 3 domain-containing protein
VGATIVVLASPEARADSMDPVGAERRLRELGTIPPLADPGSGITGDVGSIAVIEHDGATVFDWREADGTPNYAARAALAQRFYLSHADAYDFLVVFTNFEFDTGTSVAFFNPIRNDVRGIGKPLVDLGSFFGSPGRLLGMVDMGAVNRYRQSSRSLTPGEPGFVATLNVLGHQIAHQWLAGVRYRDGGGQISADLLGDGVHWSAPLDSDGSLLHGADWVANGDGTFTARRVEATLSDLDLYLMGLLPQQRVGPLTLLRATGLDPAGRVSVGQSIAGTAETVTLDQIVAAEGARSPDQLRSPKVFRVGFVLLTQRGTEPAAQDLDDLETLRRAFAGHFFALTRGLALAEASLVESPTLPGPPSPDLEKALAWLVAQQEIDGRWQDSSATAVRDTAAVLEALLRAGQSGIPFGNGLLWTKGAGVANFDFLARRAFALGLGNPTPQDRAALIGALVSGQNGDGGFGPAPGYQSDPLDTALALRALSALGHPLDATVARAIAALGALQLDSGGWTVVPGGEASAVVTAQVVLALQDWPAFADARALAATGLAALLAAENPDGGFGQSPSTTYATALALHVLVRAGAPPELVDPPTAWLQRSQREEGSWEGSRHQTALVLTALRASLAPNLIVPPDTLLFDPPEPREGETVRVSGIVRNVGRSAAGASRARLFDGDPVAGVVIADATVPPLGPGEEAAVAFDYATADRAGSRSLFVVADADAEVAEAREDDNAASRLLRVQGLLPDLVVSPADILIEPNPPEEGETVQVTVRVRNAGERASAASLVRLVRGDPRSGGVLLGEASLPEVAVGGEAAVGFAWDTTGARGEHVLFAVTDAAYGISESDESNNQASVGVEVTGPVPAGPDLEAVSLNLEPAAIATLPQSVQVTAVIRNRGRDQAVSEVALYDGDPATVPPLMRRPVDLASRATTSLTFTVPVTSPGDHTFVVVADPDGTLAESDEDNNRASAVLTDPNNTVDLEIRASDVTLSATDLVIGDDLEATVVVHNRGTVFAPVFPVILGVVTPEGVTEVARSEQSLAENGQETVLLRWKTSRTGDPVTVVVWADPSGQIREVSEANNRVDLPVTIRNSTRPNLTITTADLSVTPDPPLEGGTATLAADVRNPSPVPAGPFIVRFFAGDPAEEGVPLGEVGLPGVDASSSATAQLVWSPVELRGTQQIVVVVDAEEQVDEYDETDNLASRPLGVLGLPDLVLNAAELVLEPGFPRTGEAVTIRATVRNLGGQASPPSIVRAYEGEPITGTLAGEAALPVLAPGEVTQVAMTWMPSSPAGERLLSVLADPGDAIREQDNGNNLARRTVVVQDANLYVTEPDFSPNGDGVKDETTLAYRVPLPVSVVVTSPRGDVVRTFPPRPTGSDSVTWDGRDESGVVVADGVYTLELQGEQGQGLGRVRAVVDTNRRSLFDAVGTGLFAARQRACAEFFGVQNPLAWMPSEDQVLAIFSEEECGEGGCEPGQGEIVGFDLNGEHTGIGGFLGLSNVYFDTPNAVSPDGRAVLVTRGDVGGGGDEELYLFDLDSGQKFFIGAVPDGETSRWSPDGELIATGRRVFQRDGGVFADLPDFGCAWEWSPDGQSLACGNNVIRPDGTDLREFPLPDDTPGEVWTRTIWRADGKIYMERSEGCGGEFTGVGVGTEDCGGSKVWAGVLDPDSGVIESIDWLSNSSIFNVVWSPDATKVAFQTSDGYPYPTFIARADGSERTRISDHTVALSPRGSAAAGTDGECLNVVTSLLNLTVSFEAAALPDQNGIRINATVSDEHLDFYQLEYATQAAPDTWQPLGPASDVPMIEEQMTVWVPPAPGAYFLRLRAYDRAGNAASQTRRIVWQPASLALPAIADITQTEFLISPNGDGVKDAATFNYRVLRPTRVDVRITGPKRGSGPGPTVAQFVLDHDAIGAGSFSWGSASVPDGRYTVFINNLAFRLDVDATPPELGFKYEGLRPVASPDGRSGDLVAVRTWYVADAHLQGWTASGNGRSESGTEPVLVALLDAQGKIVFEGGAPAPVRVDGQVVPRTFLDDELVVWLGADPAATFTAVDRAGNRATVPIAPVEEGLFLLEAWPSGCRPVLLPPIDRQGTAALKPESTFHLAETIRGAGGETVRFEYHLEGETDFVVGATWTESGAFDLRVDFDQMGLERGKNYRGRFTTESGFTAEEFRFFIFDPQCTSNVHLDLREVTDAPPDPETATYEVKVRVASPNSVIFENARLNVVYDGTTGQPVGVTLDPDQPTRIVVQRPTCQNGATFSAALRPEDVEALGEGACLSLSREIPGDCPYKLAVSQEFLPCQVTSAGSVYLRASGKAREAATLKIQAGGTERASVAVPAGDFVERVLVDTVGLPEGEQGVGANLLSGASIVAGASTKIVVDRSPPLASILLPAEGASECVLAAPATGRETVRIAAAVTDLSPATTLIRREFREGSEPWRPWVCAEGECSELSFPRGAPQFLDWDVTGMAPGAHSVRLTFCDRAGYQTVVERSFSFVKDPPQIVLVGATRPVFSPNGDGKLDEARVTVHSFQALSFTVDVKRGSSQGELVRRLATDLTRPAGDNVFTWDGRDTAGAAVPDGEYVIVVVAKDGCGRTAEASARVAVDTEPPAAQITAPLGGATVSVTVDVRGTATDPRFAGYELSFGAGANPAAWAPVSAGAYAIAGGLLGRWTTPETEGTFTLRLIARDEAENASEARVTVSAAARVYLASLEAAPSPFSPNGDGQRDATTVTYVLQAPGRVFLEIRTTGGVTLRQVEGGVVRDAGIAYSVVWDGLTDPPAQVVDDGEYLVWARVVDPGGGSSSQENSVAVTVDRTPPAVIVSRPAAGAVVGRNEAVHGSVQDAQLAFYVVTATPPGGAPVELDRGVQARTDADLATLASLSDGPYTLTVSAEDVAGNRSSADVAVTVDSVVPRVLIAAPGVGAVVRKDAAPVVVTGAAVDANLSEYVLSVGPGASPAYFDEVARGSAGGESITLGSWGVASLPDGEWTLKVRATDRAGNAAETLRTVSLDGTDPVAAITAPASGSALGSPPSVTGTASDAHFESWTLEAAPGPADTPFPYSFVAFGTSAVSNGSLATWPLPPDGVYTLRLTVRDRAGHSATAISTVTVDTVPPSAPPTGLTAAVSASGSSGVAAMAAFASAASSATVEVRLAWQASTDPDVAGYRVYRNGELLTPDLLVATTFTETGLSEGSVFRYTVVAEDRAGNRGPESALTVRIDVTPPQAEIQRPLPETTVSGLVTVRGTAFSADDFKAYRLLVSDGPGPSPTSWTPLRTSSLPVVAGVLGEWTAVGEGQRILALEAEDVSGNVNRVTVAVTVDTVPPAAPVLQSATEGPAGAVTVVWDPSASLDVQGYLVHRNGQLTAYDAPGLVPGDLRAYLVFDTEYADRGVPDGQQCYRVVAMDEAGNLSPPSNEVCVSLDNRAPRAVIVEPAGGTRFDRPIRLVATSPDRDTDIASVQFELRRFPTADPWTAVGPADATPPFEADLDPVALTLAVGDYELRAVATDQGARTDLSPAAIQVRYADTEPPAPPSGLTARVEADQVHLTWQASTEPDLSAYRVYRDGEAIATATGPSFTDSGVGLGSHEYLVTALDVEDNESAVGNRVTAVVYALSLDHRFPVTTDAEVTLRGGGARPEATIQILRDTTVVAEAPPGAEERFEVPAVPLVTGGNVLTARGVDAQSNQSIPSAELVLISNAPPPPATGLAATVTGYDVDLSWNAVDDPELHGYLVLRDGQRLTGSSPETEAASLSASSSWSGYVYSPVFQFVVLGPEKAFDGDRSTAWIPASTATTADWTVTFPAPVLVDRVDLEFVYFYSFFNQVYPSVVASYRIEARWSDHFVPLIVVQGNTQTSVSHTLPSPFATDAIRVVFEAGPFHGLAEVTVSKIDAVPAGTTTFRDAGVPDGVHRYEVAAIDRYGATGETATADAPVGDVTPPAAPTGLVATPAASAVVLSWNANAEPDLDHYAVLRDGVTIATVTGTTHTDTGLVNGTYTYTVRAVDAVGNASAESDPAVAVVSVAPPIAPVLQGAADPSGGVLLGWDHAGAAAFHVSRGSASGGPYQPLATTGDVRSFSDTTAARLATHYYVVRAADAVGNLSAASNEVAVTARRTEPPAAPVITFPTDAANPITLEAAQTDVSGSAEAGTEVVLEVNGVESGRVVPTGLREQFSLPFDGYSPAVSPDGRSIVFGVPGGLLRILDRDGNVRTIDHPGYEALYAPRFSPDGGRILYLAQDYDNNYNTDLYVFDLTTGALTAVETTDDVVNEGEWSPDGTRIAFTTFGVYELRLHDLAAATTTVLRAAAPSTYYYTPSWSPDGTRIAFTFSSSATGDQVRIHDLATGGETVVDDGYGPSWSADGGRLAYEKAVVDSWRVVVRDLATGATTATTEGITSYTPRFDPNGRWLAYVVETDEPGEGFRQRITVSDLSSQESGFVQEAEGAEPSYVELVGWTASRQLAFAAYSQVSDSARVAFAMPGGFLFRDVPLRPGENVLVARSIVVPEELAGPDSQPVRVTVPAESFADLVAAGALSYPAVPLVGQVAALSAQVRNAGGVSALDVPVTLTVTSASGATVFRTTARLPQVAPGASAVVSAQWTPAAARPYVFRVQVDETDAIRESREDNNQASLALAVVASAGLGAEVRSDRTAYPVRTNALVRVRLTQASAQPYQGTVETLVEDAAGAPVARLDTRQLQLAYGQVAEFDLIWNTATTYAGSYRFRVVAKDDLGGIVAGGEQAFQVLPDVAAAARLVADRTVVVRGDTASFAARVENNGANAPIEGHVARLRLVADGSTVPAFVSETPIPAVLPGSLWEATLAWPDAAPSASYRATLEVLRPGQATVATAETAVVVVEASGLLGGLVLDPADVLVGDALEAQATVTNLSPSTLTGLPLAVETIVGATGAVVRVETAAVDLGPAETRTVAVPLSTAGLAPSGGYVVVLKAGEPPVALGSANLRVHGVIVPPSVDSPASGARVSTESPALRVNDGVSPDGASLTYEFQLFGDAALTVQVAAVQGLAETPARTAWTVPLSLQEDVTYYWRARAADGFTASAWTPVLSFTVDTVNVVPLTPVVSSPVSGQRVATNTPTLAVINAVDQEFDPLTYDFRLATDPEMTTTLASANGIPQGLGVTSWNVPVALDENATYYWSARARDGAGDDRASPWSAPASFFVDTTNESPGAPTPLRPVGGAAVPTLTPELAVGNTTDPEGDVLTYRFEVDRVPSFDSPALQASPEVPEGAGETSWTPPAELTDNSLYYWRARTTDGVTTGPWVVESFFVNLANDPPGAPVVLAPGDGEVVTTGFPTLRLRNAVDVDRDVLTYEFTVWDAQGDVVASTAGVAETPVETAWTLPVPLAENGTYSWQARAHDGQVNGEWTPVTQFRVNAVEEPPTAPTVVSPAEGAVVGTRQVTLVVGNATSPDGLTLTYAFELYAVGPSDELTLIEQIEGVTEGAQTTQWTPETLLADGPYAWRARASDGIHPSPWTPTTHFTVAVDAPPAAPTGLAAVPGDAQVSLSWNASPEPDVVGYRVYRGTTAGGPYDLVGSPTASSFVDTGLTNGVTVYYVVTTLDSAFESAASAEVAATPQASVPDLAAEVRFSPFLIKGECLVRITSVCPTWIYARIEVPAGYDPATIDVASLRLEGDVQADLGYAVLGDGDWDGRPDLKVRFPFSSLRPHLTLLINKLTVTGQAAGRGLRGSGPFGVLPLFVALSRTLSAEELEVRLTFQHGVLASDVDIATVRFIPACIWPVQTVPVTRVVSSSGNVLVVAFDRSLVEQAMSACQFGDDAFLITGNVGPVQFVAVGSLD